MFGLFKKTSEADRLQKQYEKLMAESHRLSTTNRSASDLKMAEANKVMDQLEALNKKP